MSRSSISLVFILLFSFLSCVEKKERTAEVPAPCPVVISDRLPNESIRCVGEDPYGQIWVGTRLGLARFTGNAYFQYFHSSLTNTLKNNQVTSFFTDSKGRFWILTRGGACIYTEQDDFIRARASSPDEDFITMVETDGGALLAISSFGSFYVFDEQRFSFIEKELPFEKNDLTFCSLFHVRGTGEKVLIVLSHSVLELDMTRGFALNEVFSLDAKAEGARILSAYQSTDSSICLGTGKGVVSLAWQAGSYVAGSPWWSEDFMRREGELQDFFMDKHIVVLKSRSGYYAYDAELNTLYPPGDPHFHYPIPSDYIISQIHLDRRNSLWLGSETQGVRIVSSQDRIFDRNTSLTEAFSANNVRAMDVDRSDNIFIVTEEGELYMVNLEGEIVHFDVTLPHTQTPSSLRCDPSDGTLVLVKGRYIYRWKMEGRRLREVSSAVMRENLSKLYIAEDGETVVGTYRASILVLDRDTFSVKAEYAASEIGSDNTPYNRVYGIVPLTGDDVCVSFYNNNPNILNLRTGRRSVLDLRTHVGDFLYVTAMYMDKERNLYVGAIESGLSVFDRDGNWRKVIGLDTEYIAEIAPYGDGKLWISTSRGIYLYDPVSDKLATFAYTASRQYKPGCCVVLTDGTVVFGGLHGITSCHHLPPPNEDVHLTIPFESLYVNNVLQRPSRDGCIQKSMHLLPEVHLRHNQNNIAVSFSSKEYLQYQPIMFRYKLFGYDRSWTDIGHQTMIRYSHLPPGKYRLKVQGEFLDGENIESDELLIFVKKAFWASDGMMVLYFLLGAFLLGFLLRIRAKVIAYRQAALEERRIKEQEKKLYDQNIRFFANMVHEIRSPLTLMLGPLEQLRHNKNLGTGERSILEVMKTNSDRLMKMLNQILDMNRLDSHSLSLEVTPDYPIGKKLSRMIVEGRLSASARSMEIVTSRMDASLEAPVDIDKFEAIFQNLLSNALKYSSAGSKEIVVSLFRQEDAGEVRMQMFNYCDPVPENEVERFFDRFYQMKKRSEDTKVAGTGIGLHFSRALAEIHHGSLTASYDSVPGGITFTLSIPDSLAAYASEEIGLAMTFPEDSVPAEEAHEHAEESARNLPSVLVVDDDVDIANYLKMVLQPHFNVTTVYQGKEALSLLQAGQVPDILLSDIMMPGIDGISLCRFVKENDLTCHVPVVLVTAKVDEQNKLEGLEGGADAYVTKPFDPMILVSQIRSLLKNRNLSRGTFAKLTEILSIDTGLLGEEDKAFLVALTDVLEQEISSPDLDVPLLSSRMNISRSKLFYKIKGLTGMSPLELIKVYRLKLATKLLKEGKYNVSEVAEITGFSSVSYFSTVYKKEFGISPKEVRGTV